MNSAGTDITSGLRQARSKGLIAGVVGIAVCVAGFLINRQMFFISYLEAYVFWLAVTLGCLAIMMIHNLVGGAWGVLARPFLEAASSLIPLMLLFFIPIALGMGDLYSWTKPEVYNSPIFAHKPHYLTVPLFLIRTVAFFILWFAIRAVMSHNPLQDTKQADRQKYQRYSGIGILVYGATISVASVDWLMSIDPGYFSNMYGLIFGVSELLTAWAFTIIMIVLVRIKIAKEEFPIQNLHDCGNLLLVFTMFWTYISFSQYLIIWAGQLPEEFEWYHHRAHGGWDIVGYVLLIFHFFVPFFLLLFRVVKREPKYLMGVAIWLLIMRWVDNVWQVSPQFYPHVWNIQWPYFGALLGIGGIWLWAYFGKISLHGPATAKVHTSPPLATPPIDRGPQDRPHGGRR
jgi:hypothetical protein